MSSWRIFIPSHAQARRLGIERVPLVAEDTGGWWPVLWDAVTGVVVGVDLSRDPLEVHTDNAGHDDAATLAAALMSLHPTNAERIRT